ncbi:MAG: hypothetical protein P1S60_06970 [Anaerolineae bacterium]|nr:hypothetical protein [Anaerolineae bacterium]
MKRFLSLLNGVPLIVCIACLLILVSGCTLFIADQGTAAPTDIDMHTVTVTPEKNTEPEIMPTHKPEMANVLSVEVSGTENAYQFSVEISSPDTGCEQYADWWEVLGEDGQLIYRRVLLHSHRDEQPFVRSGGPVAISSNTVVIIRAHMHPDGYGSAGIMGSVGTGFNPVDLAHDFAVDLERQDPLPDGCAF